MIRRAIDLRLLRTAAIVLFAIAGPAGADDFLAMPGLWKITFKVQSGHGATQRKAQWHCADDEVDPWINFVPKPQAASGNCTRTSSERTATSLRWSMICKGNPDVISEGQLQFDAADHYSGTLTESWLHDGHAMKRHITIEGSRQAACTTPED
jgi:hypothetical protein